MNKIYLDNGATTEILPEVREEMIKCISDFCPNPSSAYSFSDRSRDAVENSREIIASSLGVSPDEIYFTSGGSESNSWAVTGVSLYGENLKKKVITSSIEHRSLLNACEYVSGFTAGKCLVGCDGEGFIKTDEIANSISPDYSLGSFMTANNEIGVIQDIEKIGNILHEKDIVFHTDAVAAYCHIPINAKRSGIDMLSASAHKFGGPQGTGFLYISNKVKAGNLIFGGSQERGKRGGTPNVAGIVGMGKAVEISIENMKKNSARITMLRDRLIERILCEIPDTSLNGSLENRLPGNVNISFGNTDGEILFNLLDGAGICVSSGSACMGKEEKVSHVLYALHHDEKTARSSLRFTLGENNTAEEIDFTVEKLKEFTEKLHKENM